MNSDHYLNRTQPNSRKASDSGQALVEVVLITGMMLVMLIGAVEVGCIAFTAIQVTNAAKAAVQYGAQNRDTATDIPGMQTAAANGAPSLSNLQTQVDPPVCTCANDGSSVACSYSTDPTVCSGSAVVETLTVQTSAAINPLFQLPGLPTNYTLYGQAVQQVLSSNN